MRRLEELRGEYTALGEQVGERIGVELVPCPSLTRAERALALDLRRQLHNAQDVSVSACRQLARLARQLTPQAERLADDLETAARLSETIAALDANLTHATSHEEARLARVVVELVASTPLMQALLRHHNPTFYAQMDAFAQRGNSWGNKRLRRASAYLWKIIDRAATKGTPRDWHSHVALLPIADSSAISAIVATDDVATVWHENIHAQRQGLSSHPLEEDARICLALNPLRWEADDHVQFWVLDAENPTRMAEVDVQRMPLLEIIFAALAPGARLLKEFEAAALPKLAEEDHALLRMFIEHLIDLGVVQASSQPQSLVQSWRRLPPAAEYRDESHRAPAAWSAGKAPHNEADHNINGKLKSDGFLDVYRRTATILPISTCMRLQRYVEQTRRLLAIMEADQARDAAQIIADDQPHSLLALLKERQSAKETGYQRRRQRVHWPPAVDRDSPYARLLQFISARANEEAAIDLSTALLDELGAPEGAIDWPIDCVLRVPQPGAGFEAVLDEVFPAGSLDARFVTAIQSIHGTVPHADSYHEFLQRLEAESGTTLLELLIPPLSVGAANAVRRPMYARAYTGDPDISTYCPASDFMPRYVPLSAIEIRRVGSRLLAEANGRPVCPLYHATRYPLAPWNVLAETLLSTGPPAMRWAPRRLHHSLDAFPDHAFMPRITIAGQLVLAPAQWRVSHKELWDPSSGLLVKARALERLRQRLRLPRWVFISDRAGGKPVACDLESIRAIRKLEDAAQSAGHETLVVEMAPTPGQLLVADPLNSSDDYVASEIMLRLPCDATPGAMASRLAPAFSHATRRL